MLLELHVRNLAVVDEVRLDLSGGLTVMTGETGAGKSILVDALGLIAGARADAGMVRHGTDKAEVSATFSLAALPEVARWLEEQDITADDDECVARRVVAAGGRSQAYLNGTRVPAGTLAAFSERLINIHGQQANQALLRRSHQRRILDELGGLAEQTAAVSEAFANWRGARQALETLEADQGALTQAEVELLTYQANELDALALEDGEVAALEGELRVLGAAGQLLSGAESALGALAEESHGAVDRLVDAIRALASGSGVDPRLAQVRGVLEEARIQLDEGVDALQRYLSDVELDPQRLRWVEQRLASIDEVARKHRVRPGELPAEQARIEARLAACQDMEGALTRARSALDRAEMAFRERAKALSAARGSVAGDIAATAQEIIRSLGLANAAFNIKVQHQAQGTPAGHGLDEVTFEVTTNPGQPPGPLDKVASGGELSRIALALEVVAAGSTVVPCLVFDEVDTGIGGGVAEMVGRLLRRLGTSHQVLCVTHLPQVASQAHHHLRVLKETDGERTATTLRSLDGDEAVDEVARMLGGVEITSTTREHAREMREQAQRQP